MFILPRKKGLRRQEAATVNSRWGNYIKRKGLSDLLKWGRTQAEQKESGVSILLVDDHPENLLALEAVLRSLNYRLVSVNSGEEALRSVLKEDFSLILLDVQMPGLNGFETAKLIKARHKSRHIPIIFITAINQASEHVLQGYSAGAIDYIFKPFHPEALKRKIKGFVEWVQRTQELEELNAKLENIAFQLRKSEALSRTIGESSQDTIVTIDDEGYILAVNPAVYAMFGYSVEDVLGKHISQFASGTYTKHFGKIKETTLTRRDGSLFPAEIQINRANLSEQNIFVCSIRDITERKRMEEEREQNYFRLEQLVAERTADLRMSEERFRKIFAASPSLVSILSLDDMRYIDVNESWLSHTGFSCDEVIGKTPAAIKGIGMAPDDIGKVIRNAKISYFTKDGRQREGLMSNEIIEIEGQSCVLTVVTDITEQVNLEKEMARLDRLNLIGEMAAGIAHEIRNPMTTVRGFLQIAKSNSGLARPEYIELMVTELDRANDIIKEFLTLAKNKQMDRRPQNLNTLIEALYPLIQAEALLADKQVLLELQDCPSVLVDEKEIRQVILNLALNGLEAMASPGQLTIRTYCAEPDVVLEVEDQGNGITEEILDKLGTPFFTTKSHGTGLGLAVCYSVAARHNALIQVQTSGQGTTFVVRFQRCEEL